MNLELSISKMGMDDIEPTACFEANMLVDEVLSGKLPLCDLRMPTGVNRYVQIRNTGGLRKWVLDETKQKLQNQISDPDRKIFILKDADGKVLGKGGLRIKPSEKEAVLYGFYISEQLRNGHALLGLLQKAFGELGSEEDVRIVVGRYRKSELKRPLLTRISQMVNRAMPGTVITETSDWKGETVDYYLFPRKIAEDLVEELGLKLVNLF